MFHHLDPDRRTVNGPSDPVVAGVVPGWFGKLPGMGDFAHRRLPESFSEAWDRWLRSGLARLRVRHLDWPDRYLEAPLWCFVLGNDVIDARRWIGVLVPTLDRMGRHFPFTMVGELVSPDSELSGRTLARVREWWGHARRAVIEAAQGDLDAVGFEVLLHRLFAGGDTPQSDVDEATLALPVVGQSLWFTDPTAEAGLGMTSQGLPQDDQFEALFGGVPGATELEPEAS